jgi:putative FmdB family regulatory protein
VVAPNLGVNYREWVRKPEWVRKIVEEVVMPIYEYECKACGHRQEVIQKMSDAPLVECPECHKPELKKLISAAGFRLKGGGWYETDFKGGSKKNVAKDESGSKAASTSSSSDTKPKASGGGCGTGGCGHQH